MNDKMKLKQLEKVSDYKKVLKNARLLYGRDVYPSTRKEKKYMILDDNDKWVHFGSIHYQDWTYHHDPIRRHSYLKRAMNIRGNWKDNSFSPNQLSIILLW